MLTLKKPDLKAPRFKPSRYNVLNEEMIRRFKKKFPQYSKLSQREIRKIIVTYNQKIWRTVIDTREGVELPENLGNIFIGTCPPPKKYNANYDVVIKNNITSTHRNFESDNYLAKIFYTNYDNKYKFKNRRIWQFDAIREFSRTVSKEYPEKWKLYIQVDNFKNIADVFSKYAKRDWKKKEDLKKPFDYDEFNMN